MSAQRFRTLAVVAALAAAWGFFGHSPAQAGHGGVIYGGAVGIATPAAVVDAHGISIYPSPRPTPPWVGHTYIPYEPLAPHQFLHRHRDVYRRFHAQGGVTTTRVRYRTSIIGQLPRVPNLDEWVGLPRTWPPVPYRP